MESPAVSHEDSEELNECMNFLQEYSDIPPEKFESDTYTRALMCLEETMEVIRDSHFQEPRLPHIEKALAFLDIIHVKYKCYLVIRLRR